jgi:hypothetical protein
MSTGGKIQDDDDVASYVLSELGDEYNGFVAAITTMIKAQQSISLRDLYSQFLAYEARLETQNPSSDNFGESSVNAASRDQFGNRGGRGGQANYGGTGRDQYNDGGYNTYGGQVGGSNNYGSQGNYNGGYQARGGYQQRRGGGGERTNDRGRPDITYQVCGKTGHLAFCCWQRLKKNFRGPERSVNSALGAYGTDPIWYIDSGATDHIAGELDRLTMREQYNGQEKNPWA